MNLNVFGEILEELRKIRMALEGRVLPLPSPDDIDESAVLYTDDVRSFQREVEEDRFYELYGRRPIAGERLPGAVDPNGREWSPASGENEEVEGEF